jgi:hypothetical protein
MPDSSIRQSVSAATRREGRRSLSAYEPHARGIRVTAAGRERDVTSARAGWRGFGERRDACGAGEWSAAYALSLVFPLVGVRRARRSQQPGGIEGTGCMKKRKPSIKSLDTITLDEAIAYLDHAGGDELSAANALAWDRNRLDGSVAAPDEAEVHHALFLLCRARGKHAPSFDEMRVELRRRVAA